MRTIQIKFKIFFEWNFSAANCKNINSKKIKIIFIASEMRHIKVITNEYFSVEFLSN